MSKARQYNTKSLYFPSRITKTLDRILEYPLTIIEAPIGYGKTTAVREYLKNAGVDMLWQRVYDSGVFSFWNGFAKLFRELDGDRSQSLAHLRLPEDAILMQEVIKLIKDIKLPEKNVLVIDDYHHINIPSVNSFIEPKLTQREIEIARLAAAGMTNIEIGRQLFISSNTVKMTLKSIYTKLSINSRVLLQHHMRDIG